MLHVGSTLQENEILLKESLRAEAGARRARMRHRVASRVAQRTQQLKDEGWNEDDIPAEVNKIRVAGELEEKTIDAVSRSFFDGLDAGIL